MGLTKQYLRFSPVGVFGVVASKTCNAAFIERKPYRFVVTGGANSVNVWDIQLQRKIKVLSCDSPVVIIEPSPSGKKLAVGQLNGGLSVFEISDLSEDGPSEAEVVFEGHTSEVTTLCWDVNETLIASGGKDGKVVLWDIISETGVHKFPGHKGVITRVRFWAHKDEQYLVTSSYDTMIKIWNLSTKQNVHTIPYAIQVRDFDIFQDIFVVAEANIKLTRVNYNPNASDPWNTEELGILLRKSADRPSRTQIVHDSGVLLVVGVKSPIIETFLFLSEEQAIKRRSKRIKKGIETTNKFILKDIVTRGEPLKASEEKVKSVMGVSMKGQIKVLCCLPTNQLETLSFNLTAFNTKERDSPFESRLLPFDGHRKLIRGIDFSSDKTAILSASGDSFKVWNRATLSCILTISHEYPVVSCKFCPGDRHFIAGTTDGHLILGDVSTGMITQAESAGSENIWSIDVLPNSMGFVASCGNLVLMYDFQMEDGKLKFELQRQMDVQDSILCVKVSKNMKYLAMGLLDSTIKVFYFDTLKFHLTMYGHTLPIVSLDISHDNSLVVSCSGDKTVKVWGLDFGDCHCSLIHTEGLVGCCFIDKTHLIASVAKDSMNIYDADSHTRIQTVKGHVGGGATTMGNTAFLIASAGRDQALRVYERTEEILVLDDEREEEREEELQKELRTEDTGLISLATAEGEKWADRVIEAIDCFKDTNATNNPLFSAYDATDQLDFLYKNLSSIKGAELQQSLMMLPISYVEDLVPALRQILERYPLSIELVVRCITVLLKFHLVTVRSLDTNLLRELTTVCSSRLDEFESMILVNNTALEFLYNDECEKEEEQTFREIAGERKRRRRKKEKAMKRAVLLL